MAFRQFPSQLFTRVMNTGEAVQLGGVLSAKAFELGNIVVWVYRVGTPAAEQVRLRVCYDAAGLNTMAASAWVSVSTIGVAPFIGRVRFDFALRPDFPANQRFYVFAETQGGYVRTGNTSYLSFPLDWPNPVYTQLNAPKRYGSAMEIYGYL